MEITFAQPHPFACSFSRTREQEKKDHQPQFFKHYTKNWQVQGCFSPTLLLLLIPTQPLAPNQKALFLPPEGKVTVRVWFSESPRKALSSVPWLVGICSTGFQLSVLTSSNKLIYMKSANGCRLSTLDIKDDNAYLFIWLLIVFCWRMSLLFYFLLPWVLQLAGWMHQKRGVTQEAFHSGCILHFWFAVEGVIYLQIYT